MTEVELLQEVETHLEAVQIATGYVVFVLGLLTSYLLTR